MKIKKIADLCAEDFGGIEQSRRIYSPDGLAPTITCRGADEHRSIKILIEGKKDED